ncbi:MAG: arginyl-tRNA synthetase [Acidimicrobiia bacterium]|nr:arginyl-tRNA synthetase [Acidimicrobiia bacterium]
MIKNQLTDALAAALRGLGVEPPAVVPLERPARREHGDWSSTAALVSAKAAKRNPRQLAQELVDALIASPPPHVQSVDLAGPGFVNFHLAPTWLYDVLHEVVEQGPDGYARPDLGQGRSVLVEFVSANPTGPLHAGHGRNAAYGDAVARLLQRTGWRVHREFYLNDRGAQMENFAASLAARKAGLPLPENGYAGEYISEWAEEMPDGADPQEWGRERAIADHKATLERLRVHFDSWFSERSMLASGAIEQTLADLRDHDVVYESDGAVWLRSTDFGDDKDRVLIRSEGGDYTYLTPDIAYHRDKYARGHDWLIDVWGADHHGYIPRLRAALQALGHPPETFTVCITQLVQLMREGREVRLSKRTGEIITVDEVLEEVGPDAARLTYLLQSVDSRQIFDLTLAAAQRNENPVFYVQYAHARIHSLQRVAKDAGVVRRPLEDVDLSPLTHERELEILRDLAELPDVVELAARELAPHKITTWVRELAGDFHGFYHDCRVMGEGIDEATTQARLWLVEASRIGLAIGLDLLGVDAPTTM